MDPHHIALAELRVELIDNLGVNDILDYLIAKHCINQDEEEQIIETKGNRAKARELVRILSRKPLCAFNALQNALDKTGSDFLARKLQEKLEDVQRRSQDPSTFDVDPSQIRGDTSDLNPSNTAGDTGLQWLDRVPVFLRNQVPSDPQLTLLAMQLIDVDLLGAALGLSNIQIQQCKLDNPHNLISQNISVLQVWKRHCAREATTVNLVLALSKFNLLSSNVHKVIETEFCTANV